MPLNTVKAVRRFLLLAIVFQAGQQSAFACQCLPGPASPLDELYNAKMVFSGKVIANTTGMKYQIVSKFPFIARVWAKGKLTFAVQSVWKGDLAQEITTPDFSCDCCGSFKIGKEYLVYASEGKNGYGERILITFCSRTTELASAGGDLAVLGKGSSPNHLKNSSLPAIAVLIATLTVPILVLQFIKKRYQKT